MSRCFPFSRTGYEKKPRTDEVDLLKKEKQKEKKHKKDKREKDKRESKEKREKEGRDGKHKDKKDKKDKKEKHKEKKKDKSKDKDKSGDKDKSKIGTVTADDKGFLGHPEGANAGKFDHKDYKQSDKKDILFDNRLAKQYTGSNNGQKARDNNHLVEENKESKFLLELDRRIRDVDEGVGNQLVQFTNSEHSKDEGTVKLVAKRPDGNEKLMDKSLDAKKIDGKGMWTEAQPIGNAPVQNHAGSFHPKVDGIPRLLGKYSARNLEVTLEGKEKVKEKKDEEKEKVQEKKDEGEGKVKEKKNEGKQKVKEKKDDNRKHKRKDKEKEKKGHGKDKDRDKEKKKEEKAKELGELKTMEQNKLNKSNKIGTIDSNSFTPFSKNNHEIAGSGENVKKRKDIESNGAPLADDNWPNKFPRSSSSLPTIENGRILEACQISIPKASNRSQLANSVDVKVETKECKINGIIEAQPFAVPSNKTQTPTDTVTMSVDPVIEASAKPMSVDPIIETSAKPMSVDPIIEASAKPPRPPHPDTKYLSQVCSVPIVEQWSEFGDQEWLFGNSLSQERKPGVESSEVGETSLVWAEALLIEPVDIFALPYVIPY